MSATEFTPVDSPTSGASATTTTHKRPTTRKASLVGMIARSLRNYYMKFIYSVALALNGYKFFFACKYIYDYYWYNDALYHIYPWQRWLLWAGYSTNPMVSQSHPAWIMLHLITTFILMDSLVGHFVASWHCDPMNMICTKTDACSRVRSYMHWAFCLIVALNITRFGAMSLTHSLLLNGLPLILLLLLWWQKWLFAYFCVLTSPVLYETVYLSRTLLCM